MGSCLGHLCGRALLAAVLMQGFAAALSAEEEHGEAEVHHRHHVGVFFGGAVRDEEHTESGFALGADYQYRFTQLLSAGALAEVATGDLREVLLVAPIYLHPWRGLAFAVGPGAEIPSEGNVKFAMRFGVGYRFPVGQFTIRPEFIADLVEGTPTYVIGLSFGVGF
jgi:hypothetical protein